MGTDRNSLISSVLSVTSVVEPTGIKPKNDRKIMNDKFDELAKGLPNPSRRPSEQEETEWR